MLLVDTCQAASMMHQLGAAPPVVSLASSRTGQNSYSYVTDHALGVALSDRFTFHLHRFLMWHHQHKGRAAPPTVGPNPNPNPDPNPDPNPNPLTLTLTSNRWKRLLRDCMS